ncbi:MAG TPA: MFS transporter [Negativicutes bacterium]|jgi:predicted MFS family arabinose efflux permease
MDIQAKGKNIPNWITLLLATACGVIVANIYYAQPLVGPISAATNLSPEASGLIVTLTQIGYGIGLLFIVPLSDLIENRRLVVAALVVVICGLVAAALARNALLFLAASLLIGLGSVAAQVLVPYAAHLASPERRGRVVGNVMSGLLLGIMLARPVASLITDIWGWQAMFFLSAVINAVLTIILVLVLPRRMPEPAMKYGQLIGSLWFLFKTTAILRRRAIYQACLFGAFSLFWTVVPLWLASYFHLSQQGIALFALAGVAGAIAAPIAGRLADRGWTRLLTGLAIVIAALSFLVTHIFQDNSATALAILVLAAIMLDMGVSGNLVLGQRMIYSLGSEIRGRLNGLYMATFFVGGAVGSALGGWSYAYGGWQLASILGFSMPVAALLYYFTEKE